MEPPRCLVVATLVALASLAACAAPPARPPRLPPPDEWTSPLPASIHDPSLHAADDCVFVTGRERGRQTDALRALCFAPASGELRWSVRLDDLAESEAGGLAIADERVVFVGSDRVVALDRGTGELAWTFDELGGMRLYRALVAGNTVLVSLGNRHLVVLDAESGAVVRRLPLADDSLEMAVATDAGTLAMVARVEDGAARLVAVPTWRPAEGAGVDTEGKAPVEWELPIVSWTGEMHAVGGVLVAPLRPDEIWAVSIETGEVLWQLPRGKLESPLAYGPNHLILSGRGTLGEGPALELRAYEPAAVPSGEPRWILAVPTAASLLGVEAIGGTTRAFGATVDRYFVFDDAEGRLIWTYAVGGREDPGSWTSATSNGDAVFALYLAPGGRVLRRISVHRE